MIEYHSIPPHDLREHEVHKDCWCRPELIYDEDEDAVWFHKAMDQREKYLSGELKPM